MCEACDVMASTNMYDEGFEAGQLAEHNRIAALLETLKCGCEDDCDIVEIPFRHLVTLIKGENK